MQQKPTTERGFLAYLLFPSKSLRYESNDGLVFLKKSK